MWNQHKLILVIIIIIIIIIVPSCSSAFVLRHNRGPSSHTSTSLHWFCSLAGQLIKFFQ